LALLAAAVLGATSGCGGGDYGSVSGTVTLDGQPLSGAQVMFMPDEGGGPSFGETDTSGKYVLTHNSGSRGAVIGAHSVAIEMGEDEEEYDASGMDEGTLEEQQDEEKTLPARYNEESELTAIVEKGDNTVDFALTSD